MESGPSELRAGEDRFTLLNHMPVGVCIIDPKLNVVFWNDCMASWTGISADGVLGTSVTSQAPYLLEVPIRAQIDVIFEGGPTIVFPSTLYRHFFPSVTTGGAQRVQKTTVTAVPESTRTPSPEFYAMITVEDVTELTHRIQDYKSMHQTARDEVARREALEVDKKRMEEQAREMQKLESIGVLASGIAHDFNNLLAVIVGNADLIDSDVADVALVQHCVGEIHKASDRATDLVSQILSYSGGGMFQLSPTNLSTIVSEMRYLITATISKKINLTFELSEDLPKIVGDESQLKQLIVNIVTNASEAIAESSGTIVIRTGTLLADAACIATMRFTEGHQPGTYSFLEITDSGAGFENDMVDKIFDPFFTTKFTGRGLGLAAVLGIVRAHKGAISVTSTPEKGTTFIVIFPAIEAQATVDALPLVDEVVRERPCGGGVLLVDDEEMVRELGMHILQGSGYTVFLAVDGDDALSVFESQKDNIDVILLDVMLPSKDGLDVSVALKPLCEKIPIVLCSGYTRREVERRYPGIEFSAFLKKPFSADTMRQVIEDVLSSSS